MTYPRREAMVLTVNAGSSSLRMAIYQLHPRLIRVAGLRLDSPPASASVIHDFFAEQASETMPDIVIHRVVHGGRDLSAPCVIDAQVEATIDRLSEIAPLHNPVALRWIRAAREIFGAEVAQAACFDTAFFATLPPAAATYALPRAVCEAHGIRRYGFHGLAHQSMVNRWQQATTRSGRVISLQLGAGCSVTASDSGRAVETSMGFSPLEGLVMATRCGDLDPAVVLHLASHGGPGFESLERMLNESSGLLAVSEESSDMRTLLDSGSARARLAIEMFCHRARKYLGAYLAVLGGADAVLFGGGIGEHAPEIRARILGGLDWAGIRLDETRSQAVDVVSGGPIHANDSAIEVWVTPTDEEGVMAEAAHTLWVTHFDGRDVEVKQ